MELVPVPGAVFGTLLREIDDLAELKTLLHVLRLLHAQPRPPRFVRRAHLLTDSGLLQALGRERGRHGVNADATVSEALARAVARGTLLAVRVTDGTTEDECYLLNTRGNERIVQEIEDGERQLGELGPVPAPHEPADLSARATIYELYEQNIGLLTPLLAEELSEAAENYPAPWVEDAFREAVAQNKRSWRYVRRILETWASQGRGSSGTTSRRPSPPPDSSQYLEGRYGRLARR
ncbi:MAG: DnaD domain protein [Chloroflexi bacterium]|nr:DnaD domain protein [Chloroflexota bacterium]